MRGARLQTGESNKAPLYVIHSVQYKYVAFPAAMRLAFQYFQMPLSLFEVFTELQARNAKPCPTRRHSRAKHQPSLPRAKKKVHSALSALPHPCRCHPSANTSARCQRPETGDFSDVKSSQRPREAPAQPGKGSLSVSS